MRALVIGATGGIGAALTAALRGQGAEVTPLSRRQDGLDITDETGVAACLGRLEGPFERIIIASGALEAGGGTPEKALRQVDAAQFEALMRINALGPALVMKHALRLLPRDRPAVLAALSARVGSIGDNRAGGWYSYRASKAALNQLVRTTAIELGRTHPQAVCVALHPGTVSTPLTRRYLGRHPAVAPGEAARNLLAVIDALTAEDSGSFRDWAGKPVAW